MSRKPIARPFPADLPGVTVEWLARANNCSSRTIRRRRKSLPPDDAVKAEILAEMTPELAQEMAQLRNKGGILPFWSRLAIAELAADGATYAELMETFGVGRSTVYRAIHQPSRAYCVMSGRRQLTERQFKPIR